MTNCETLRQRLEERGKPACVPLTDPPEQFANDELFAGSEGLHLLKWDGTKRDEWDIWTGNHCWTLEDEKAGLGKAWRFKPGTTFRAKLVALTLCDSSGELLFNPYSEKDVAVVASLDGDLLDWIDDQARRVNGLRALSQEEAAKNSDPGASEDTGLSSPPFLDAPLPSVSET